MSKKITLYELLGLIKNEKELPEKIKFHDVVYELKSEYGYCKDYYNEGLGYLFNDDWALTNNLKEEVEILDNKIEYREDKITIVKNLKKCNNIPAGAYGVLLDSSNVPYVSWFNSYKNTYNKYIYNKSYKNVWSVSLDNLKLVFEIDK